MIRLHITRSSTEAEALTHWSVSELRDPRDQIRFLLQRELRSQGLLSDRDAYDDQSAKEKSDG
jgi:hypothetical protein